MWCFSCKTECEGSLCRSCRRFLVEHSYRALLHRRCKTCGRPVLDTAYPCPYCKERIDAFGPYEGILADLIIRYKAKGEWLLAFFLADLYTNLVKDMHGFVLIPIPCSKQSLRRRGFDQMWLVCRILQMKHNCPMVCLFDINEGNPMKFLSRKARLQLKSMQIRKNRIERITALISQGYRLLLLDDIRTTGATINRARQAISTELGIFVDAVVLAQA